MGKTIHDILNKYYVEASGGLVLKAPSTLNRGEGTEKEFYIYKIDLVGSTLFTWSKTSQTYLKIAHTFLSTIDEITRIFGSDDNQVEYAGDSVIAYFPSSVPAADVLKAAYYCREATLHMRTLDTTFKQHHFHTKTVLHYGKLIMANIGPRGDSSLTAIGKELHKACKMEADVKIGSSLVSKEFYGKLDRQLKRLLEANFKEVQVLKENIARPSNNFERVAGLLGSSPSALSALAIPQNNSSSSSPSLLGQGLRPFASGLSELTIPTVASLPIKPQFETKYEVQNYSIKWQEVSKFLQ